MTDTEPRRLIGWVLEWGAVSLPYGHDSRITCMEIHETQAKAEAAQKDVQFDSRIFPVYTGSSND